MSDSAHPAVPATEDAYRDLVLDNPRAMLLFALRRGLPVPDGAAQALHDGAALPPTARSWLPCARRRPRGSACSKTSAPSRPSLRALGATRFGARPLTG
jgi:hypothetical protein